MKNNPEKAPQRLTREVLHQLLRRVKNKAEQLPVEKGSFRLEVICNKEDMEKK
jgi:hypothetical protein